MMKHDFFPAAEKSCGIVDRGAEAENGFDEGFQQSAATRFFHWDGWSDGVLPIRRGGLRVFLKKGWKKSRARRRCAQPGGASDSGPSRFGFRRLSGGTGWEGH